jgi:hypothetical protein
MAPFAKVHRVRGGIFFFRYLISRELQMEFERQTSFAEHSPSSSLLLSLRLRSRQYQWRYDVHHASSYYDAAASLFALPELQQRSDLCCISGSHATRAIPPPFHQTCAVLRRIMLRLMSKGVKEVVDKMRLPAVVRLSRTFRGDERTDTLAFQWL